jgi:hypothetical protein
MLWPGMEVDTPNENGAYNNCYYEDRQPQVTRILGITRIRKIVSQPRILKMKKAEDSKAKELPVARAHAIRKQKWQQRTPKKQNAKAEDKQQLGNKKSRTQAAINKAIK